MLTKCFVDVMIFFFKSNGVPTLCVFLFQEPLKTNALFVSLFAPRFSCNCTAGWNGSNCTDNIDECESAPCVNGATCIDQLNSYECVCVPGYTGRFIVMPCQKKELLYDVFALKCHQWSKLQK